VTLLIEYKSGADMEKKLYDLREKHSLEAENISECVLLAMSRNESGQGTIDCF